MPPVEALGQRRDGAVPLDLIASVDIAAVRGAQTILLRQNPGDGHSGVDTSRRPNWQVLGCALFLLRQPAADHSHRITILVGSELQHHPLREDNAMVSLDYVRPVVPNCENGNGEQWSINVGPGHAFSEVELCGTREVGTWASAWNKAHS